jgi:mannosyl-oligosaccharide alpha-1,2-mannosidase
MKGSGESIQIDDKINSVSFEDDPISLQRREKVKDAMIHAWTSYEKYAWGKDELKVFPLVNILLYSSLQF